MSAKKKQQLKLQFFNLVYFHPHLHSTRKRCGWKKFKDIATVLCKTVMPLQLRGSMYKCYIKSASCYGAECWAL